jgi:nicotinamide N-methyltransferase
VCAVNGAAKVVVTDYPDTDLIENLRFNIAHCEQLPAVSNIVAEVLFTIPLYDARDD